MDVTLEPGEIVVKKSDLLSATGIIVESSTTNDVAVGDICIVTPEKDSSDKYMHAYICTDVGSSYEKIPPSWTLITFSSDREFQRWEPEDDALNQIQIQLFGAVLSTCKGKYVKFQKGHAHLEVDWDIANKVEKASRLVRDSIQYLTKTKEA